MLILRIFLTLLLITLAGFSGFAALFIINFGGAPATYITIAITIALIIFIILFSTRLMPRKTLYNGMGIFLGFCILIIAGCQINKYRIDNIPANSNTIRTGTYPLTTQFYAVTTNQAKPNTKKLLNWVLSGQGQSIIEKTGYVSLHAQPE